MEQKNYYFDQEYELEDYYCKKKELTGVGIPFTEKSIDMDRYYFDNVNYNHNNKIKNCGAKWDPNRRQWYVTNDKDKSKIESLALYSYKYYFNVKFKDKDKVKQNKAKWDRFNKKWYVTNITDRDNLISLNFNNSYTQSDYDKPEFDEIEKITMLIITENPLKGKCLL
tara:strand:- start:1214 stop:1717 length:504 start_codon:yes stop_codon:yes gene_type:complete